MVNNNDFKIVRFTNISNFDFTPEMGAMYGGVPYFVPSGGSLLCPLTIGEHLGTHLARQMFLQKAPGREDVDKTSGLGAVLWTEESIKALRNKMLSESYEEEKPAPQSEAERMAQRVVELNRFEQAETQQPQQPPQDNDHVLPGASQFPAADGMVYKDKAEVIEALKARGIKYDARQTKATLEKLLK